RNKENTMQTRIDTRRRDLVRLAGVAAGAALLGMPSASRVAYADALTKAQRDKLTPDQIIALMKQGNERFRLGKESPHHYLAQQKASAEGQYPAAVILSCIIRAHPRRRSWTWASATASTRAWLATLRTRTFSGAWSLHAKSLARRSFW